MVPVETLDRQTAVRSKPGVVSREVDRQEVILTLATGRYYSLNETGSLVWRRLRAGATLGELEHDLRVAFDDPPTAWGDLVQCIQELAREDLIEIS